MVYPIKRTDKRPALKVPPVKLQTPASKKPIETLKTNHTLTPHLVAWFIRQHMKDFTGLVLQGDLSFEFVGGQLKQPAARKRTSRAGQGKKNEPANHAAM